MPGILSRSMIFLSASAAVMLSGMPGVVAFAVPGRAFDDRIVVGDAGLLRRLRDAVDVRAERDDRLARAPRRRSTPSECRPRSRSTVKPFFFEDAVRYFDVSTS